MVLWWGSLIVFDTLRIEFESVHDFLEFDGHHAVCTRLTPWWSEDLEMSVSVCGSRLAASWTVSCVFCSTSTHSCCVVYNTSTHNNFLCCLRYLHSQQCPVLSAVPPPTTAVLSAVPPPTTSPRQCPGLSVQNVRAGISPVFQPDGTSRAAAPDDENRSGRPPRAS